ncbi:MAG: VCBS repeat-containing protein [Pseudomonadota bacterium]|nr:VCBS repeat-containing protein [Pseudomonadota bacterium]
MRDFFYLVRTASLAGTLTLLAVSGRAADAEPGAFADRVTLPAKGNAHAVFADDLNGDGHLDLIVAVAGANSIAVYDGHGDGTFAAPRYFPVGVKPKFVATGDFNHDMHRDIVVAEQDSNSISVLLGNGDGTFRSRTTYASCNGDHELVVADFNRDGNDDVAVACHTAPYFTSVFLGNGDGTFKPRIDLYPGASPGAVTAGDFNGDGIPDLAFANHADDTVAVILNNGDGTFKPPLIFKTGQSPHSIRAADLNGDGILDLVTINDGGRSVTVFAGKGDGQFERRLDLPAASLPKSVAFADFNGDGKPDIVITNTTYPSCCTYDGSLVSVFMNQGDFHFAPRRDYYAGGNPFSLLVRDLNGDGKADIATANWIDATRGQRAFNYIMHESKLTSRMLKFAFLGLGVLAGGLIIVLLRRSSKLAALVCSVLVAGAIWGFAWSGSRVGMEGDSHVSILFAR